jgi:hypothetical protein
MGKSVVTTNLITKAKSIWGWFIKKSPAFIVLTSLTVVSVFGLGVGGTLAATGVIPNPFANQEPEVANQEPDATSSEQGSDSDFPDSWFENNSLPPSEMWNGEYSEAGDWITERTPLGSGGPISYRWSTVGVDIRYIGNCPSGALTINVAPPNYGYLSHAVAGIQGIGAGGGSIITPSPGQTNCANSLTTAVRYMKCFNFSEVWIDIEGPTPQAGFYKIPIPESISKVACPPGSENNDPSKFMFAHMYEMLKDYPEAVVTPPTFGSPATIEWGPYVPSTPTPSPTPTAEPSPTPTPTTEPSPPPTPETSPTPTIEPSPTPTSP